MMQKEFETEMAQLDTDFLFNTLNNIDVLILKNAKEASAYLNKLSDILRFMLFETKMDKILFSKEIGYIEKYIELQKLRTSNSNNISFRVTGTPGNKMIAPMIFIPFVENAFKHTNNKKLDNAVAVKILIKNETILFVCENKYNSNTKMTRESEDVSNDTIKQRLNFFYPQKHTLEIINRNELYCVHLIVDNELI